MPGRQLGRRSNRWFASRRPPWAATRALPRQTPRKPSDGSGTRSGKNCRVPSAGRLAGLDRQAAALSAPASAPGRGRRRRRRRRGSRLACTWIPSKHLGHEVTRCGRRQSVRLRSPSSCPRWTPRRASGGSTSPAPYFTSLARATSRPGWWQGAARWPSCRRARRLRHSRRPCRERFGGPRGLRGPWVCAAHAPAPKSASIAACFGSPAFSRRGRLGSLVPWRHSGRSPAQRWIGRVCRKRCLSASAWGLRSVYPARLTRCFKPEGA